MRLHGVWDHGDIGIWKGSKQPLCEDSMREVDQVQLRQKDEGQRMQNRRYVG